MTRAGNKVICMKCGSNHRCVGTIVSEENWYGHKIVNVYFDKPRWDQCEQGVYYSLDLESAPAK